MRVAALYDIHGNLPALDAVLEAVGRAAVDRIVVGGDVLPGPMPTECLDRLAALGDAVTYLRGNGEGAVLDVLAGRTPRGVPAQIHDAIAWVAGRLGPEHRRTIAAWPATVTVSGTACGDVLFCHATPRNDTDVFTRETRAERLRPWFDPVAEQVVVCGHTHMQFDRSIGSKRVVNAGSVGMPFGAPGAYWAVLDTDVELRRTGYDLARAASAIESTDYPGAAAFARQHVVEPPSEAQMLEAFAGAAAKGPGPARRGPDAGA